MSQFLGTHQNRLDAKGRVSVPAPFRNLLKSQTETDGNGTQLVLRPSHQHPCIEAWPPAEFAKLAQSLNSYDLFSEEHDDLATALYAEAFPVESDKEGRIMLPDVLAAHAGLTDAVVFMGAGRIFQIWEPTAAERRRTEARERARVRGFTLNQRPAAAPPVEPSA